MLVKKGIAKSGLALCRSVRCPSHPPLLPAAAGGTREKRKALPVGLAGEGIYWPLCYNTQINTLALYYQLWKRVDDANTR